MLITVAVPIGTRHRQDGQYEETDHKKITLCTAIAVFSLGIGASYAGDGDGHSATTLFTSIQNERAVAAPKGTAQNSGHAVQAYDTRSQGQGTWLFRVFSLP